MSSTSQAKKLVMAIFLLMIGINIGVQDQQFKCVPSIQYPVKITKGHTPIQALIDTDNEVNVITSAYAAVSALDICPIDSGVYKIDRSKLSTYNIVLANFYL